jgi:hypothetical protein
MGERFGKKENIMHLYKFTSITPLTSTHTHPHISQLSGERQKAHIMLAACLKQIIALAKYTIIEADPPQHFRVASLFTRAD